MTGNGLPGPEADRHPRFGFQVREDSGAWSVELPHSCDAWEITEGAVSQAQAIDALERFLLEGREALDALLARREHGRERGGVFDEFKRLRAEDAAMVRQTGNPAPRDIPDLTERRAIGYGICIECGGGPSGLHGPGCSKNTARVYP